jgi:O-succinylbenzoic acid--CoA ligase
MGNKELNFKLILEKYALNTALIWSDGKLAYHQYIQQITSVSEVLKNHGVSAGSRVAVLSDINQNFPILFFAILTLGGIVVPINPKLPYKTISNYINEIECEWLIIFDSSYSVGPGSRVKLLEDVLSFDEEQTPEKITPLSFSQDATILFTSGSGGKPKAVLHTISNHYYSALGSNENIPLKPEDCWMVSLPFFHIAGIAILFRTLLTGAACYIPDRSRKFHEELYDTKVTHLSMVSTQLYRWLEHKEFKKSRSTLKAVLLGGSRIPEMLVHRAIQKNIPIYTSYGSTEMSSQITTTTFEDLKLNPQSSGKLLSYRELNIDDTGEIMVRGGTLCKGYISAREILPCTDEKGWFHTGDLGYVDENQNLIVIGRQDNMFISGGENVYPEEIEQHLQFHNHITDVCVVDVKDDEFGARPVAFVKMGGDKSMNETDLKESLRNKIAVFKIPDRFFLWPENIEGLKPDREYFRALALENMRSK